MNKDVNSTELINATVVAQELSGLSDRECEVLYHVIEGFKLAKNLQPAYL